MGDVLSVHVTEAIENLLGEVLYVSHWDGLSCFLGLAQLILETSLTVLHHDVLNEPLLLVQRVEKFDELHDVRRILQQSHDFILSRDNIASLLGPLDSNLNVSILVEGLEDKSY